MFNRFFSTNLSLAALAAAAFLAAAPASAVEIGNSSFTLTFPDGWSKLSVGGGDSAVVAMKTGGTGTVVLTGMDHAGALTPAELAAYMAQYSAADSMTVADQGTKNLNGKSYSFIEFKRANPSNEVEGTMRFRFYFINQGNYLFQAFSYYSTLLGSGAVPDIESALGTLRLTPSSSVRAAAINAGPQLRPANRDILGRSQHAEIRKTPLFRLPSL